MTQENYNSHGQPLDGTGKIKPVPFDAHEQATRGEHVPTEAGVHTPLPVEEYPKAIDHDEKTGEPIIAKDAAHEKQLLADRADEKESA